MRKYLRHLPFYFFLAIERKLGTQILKITQNLKAIITIGILASNIAANGNVQLNSARDILIQSSEESRTSENTSNNKAIGKVVISDTERFSGYHTESHNDQGADKLQIQSSVVSLGKDVTINANNTYTQRNNRLMIIDGTIFVSGSSSIPTIATARDIGNVGVSYVSGYNGNSWITTRAYFDAYNAYKNLQFSEADVSKAAEQIGWTAGNKGYNRTIATQIGMDNKVTIPQKPVK